jgi:hypothetical protein
MTTLTERYLAATLRHVPARQRVDVERELRSSIADAVEDRVAAGESQAVAETAVLEGLGDPGRLAAELSGRPMYLIGPDLFLDYRRLLTVVLGIVVPITAAALGAIELVRGGGIGDAIGAAIGAGINVAIHICFWVTLIFVLVERADSFRKDGTATPVKGLTSRWTIDDLPAISTGKISLTDTIGELVTLLVTIGGLILLRTISINDAQTGQSVPLLDPGLASFWLPYLVATLVTLVGFRIVLHVVGRWTVPMAIAHAIMELAFAVPVVYLALNGDLINPAFAAAVGYPPLAESRGWAMVIIAVSVTAVTAWEIVDGFRRARRDSALPDDQAPAP